MKKIQTIYLSRFRPVMISSITTIFGMVPMLITSGEGSNLLQPLSLKVISGLTFSTALTLLIVPLFSFYLYGRSIGN